MPTSEALRDELESDSPGAAAVGRLVLETRDLEAQVRDEIRGFSDAFRELLDPDQQLTVPREAPRRGAFSIATCEPGS